MKPLLRLLLAAAIVTLPFGFVATPALADLRVCNQTRNPVNIALGYRAERGWQSEGWWSAGPDECATVYLGDLNSRFYYIYAADDVVGGAWDGTVFMCTRDQVFTIFGVEDCLARGYDRTGFFEVDTQNRTDWTLELTEKDLNNTDALGTDAPGVDANDTDATGTEEETQ